ncbi:SDR family NAD(P)-dependent oxidoreductase [Campylobacter jejuni]|uniref:SDR family NAD(P)-dependent oxidoreductase n=1 Tax=Campylobacter jejuni TaxID=197 RepID=UPI002B226C37|nr:SDR family NAD(P)-dependent oxidoreductase [Campylobacter jejuni]MEA8938385.1 SDR family NAD(P)-dependent oxidoreductase [Campylobacter jejuni]
MNYKTVLVTGADGFIGSHLIEMLYKESLKKESIFFNSKIKALSQYNSFNYWGWLEDIECLNKIEVICGDIRDPYFCNKIMEEVDIVFHLAALIAIPFSYVAPDSYVDVNVKGTLNICQAALRHKVKRIIHTSTSEVYGSAIYVPIDEKHPLQPQSPYSASKIAADAMAMSFFNTFNLPLIIARPFNTYGPRQSARAIIPTIITQIASGVSAINLGDLSPTRDFNYVKDTCLGFLELAKCNEIGEVINIGSNYEISIKEILELIMNIMKTDIKIISDDKRIRPENSEVFRLWCDNRKILQYTDFKPKYSLEEGLKESINWYTNPLNLQKFKSHIYNI